MQCVPYPDLTRSDGVFNLAAHSPYNAISPDLSESALFGHITTIAHTSSP